MLKFTLALFFHKETALNVIDLFIKSVFWYWQCMPQLLYYFNLFNSSLCPIPDNFTYNCLGESVATKLVNEVVFASDVLASFD